MPDLPTKLFDLTDALTRHGWSYQLRHGTDTGGSPYVTVEGLKPDTDRLIVTWHTRHSGPYRVSSVLIGDRSGTYADALRHVKGEQ